MQYRPSAALCSSESHRKGFHQRSPIRSKRIDVTKLANKRGDNTTGGHSLHEAFQEDALKRPKQHGISVVRWRKCMVSY